MKVSMTRRTFLKTSLAGLTGLTLGYRLEPLFAKGSPEEQTVSGQQVTVFLNISESGKITIVCARAEMGQGIATGFAQIVAEELEADWSTISIELRPELEPYDISWFPMTVGSMSTQTHYTPLREIGAAAKQMLLSAAAQRWGVSVDSLQAENGYVTHPEKGSLGYGELAAEAGTLPMPEKPQLKDPADFTIVGTSRPRLDAADHLSGSAVYATDVVVDDMLYASIRHANPKPSPEQTFVCMMLPEKNMMIKRRTFIIFTFLLFTISAAGLSPHCCFAAKLIGLNGTVWKIISWATDDEHIGFYDGRCYYIVGEDLFSVYLLDDSFYRDYDRYGFGAGVVPERLVNYPGDIVFWGIINYRARFGAGMSLPLPVPAILVLKETGWEP